MTRNELRKVFSLDQELKILKSELDKLEQRIGSSGKWIDGMPRGSGTSDPTGNIASEIANSKLMITCKELEIQIQKRRVIQFIDQIDDSVMRQIVFFRCVALKPWNRVAEEVGITAEGARKAFERYFNGGNDERERLT